MSQSEKDILPTGDEPTDYSKCTITDIRRGKGLRAIYTYAKLRNERGEVVISADLDYILEKLEERLPGKIEPIKNQVHEVGVYESKARELDSLGFKEISNGLFVPKDQDRARKNYQDAIEKYEGIPLEVPDEGKE